MNGYKVTILQSGDKLVARLIFDRKDKQKVISDLMTMGIVVEDKSDPDF